MIDHNNNKLTTLQLSKVLKYAKRWDNLFNQMGFANEYETLSGLCVDGGYPESAHSDELFLDGQKIENKELSDILRNSDVEHPGHVQIGSGTKYVFDLKGLKYLGGNEVINHDNILEELGQGRAQVMVSPDGKHVTVSIPGDSYSCHPNGTGPAFGNPYTGKEGVDPLIVLGLKVALAKYSPNLHSMVEAEHLKCGLFKANNVTHPNGDPELKRAYHLSKEHHHDGQTYHNMAQEGNGFPGHELAIKELSFDALSQTIEKYAPHVKLYSAKPITVTRDH